MTISVSPPSPDLPRAEPSRIQLTRTRAISTPAPPRLTTDLPARSQSRLSSPTPSFYHQLPSFSLIGALEFHDVIASLRGQAASPSLVMFDSPVTPYAGGHYHKHPASRQRTPRTSLSSRDDDPSDQLSLNIVNQQDDRLRPHVVGPSRRPDEPQGIDDDHPSTFRDDPHDSEHPQNRYLDAPQDRYRDDPGSSSVPSDADTESQNYVPPSLRQRIHELLLKISHTLVPSLHNFGNQGILGQVASIFAAPAVMALTLTLPVVVTPYEPGKHSREKLLNGDDQLLDFEEEGEERVLIAEEEVMEDMHGMSYNKWLMAAQCAIAPAFCVGVLFSS